MRPRTSNHSAAPHRLRPRPRLIELMSRYVAGDDEPFDELHRAIAPHVRWQIRSVLGRDPATDDLVQNTFLKAHAARHRFDPKRLQRNEGVLGWYRAIARNEAVSELRRRYAGTSVAFEPEADLDAVPCERPNAERRTLVDEHQRRVRAVVRGSLAELPEPQRRVVELHKLRELPMREVAHRLGIRPGAARVRAHRAYRVMAERLVELHPED